MIEYEIYIEPISRDNSVGSNVEYESNYLNLLDLIRDKPEQQYGDVIIEAKEKDWEKIFNISSDILLEKSKDLNVMSIFTLSSIYCYGVTGLYSSLKVIYENLNLYWEDIYPSLCDEDNTPDVDYRINSLSLLNSNEGVIKALKSTILVKNKLINNFYTFKDVEKILENPTDSHNIYPGGNERLYVDLKMAIADDKSEISLLVKSLDIIKNIIKLFDSKVGYSELQLHKLEEFINKFVLLLEDKTKNQVAVNVQLTKNSEKDVIIGEFHWNNIEIKSRNDIDLLLEKIYLYFEKNEPSHPAPLFIRRIQRLMTYNFYEIMKDISPDSMDKLINLVGQPTPTENNSTE